MVLHSPDARAIRVQTETDAPVEMPDTLDGPACASIFYAMQHCQKLVIKGAVSEKFLRNIFEFQEAWHCHYPDLYHVVDIEPTEISTSETPSKSAPDRGVIQTFSGGVDSIFSLTRRCVDSEPIGVNATSALLVHGFDVPCANQSDFDTLRKRIEKITDNLGVQLHVLKTSYRDSLPTNWEHSHGAALASVLHHHAPMNRLGIIASSDPYNYVSFVPHAWGSNPATDHLLSGNELEIFHDGAGYSRPQKIAFLAKEVPQLLSLAQFCWQGERRAENCGKCDKCVHTRLSLRAVGQSESICFETPFQSNMLEKINFGAETLGDLLPLIHLAESNGYTDPWVSKIKERVAPFMPVMHKSNRSLGRSMRYFQAAIRELLPSK
jgi:hypothetical protein